MMTNDNLERRLAAYGKHDDTALNQAMASRVMTQLADLPPQRRGLLSRWLPSALLNPDFAPAWPRVTALAGVAVLGFAVCFVGLDLRPGVGLRRPVLISVVSDNDLNAMFEAEPLTGLRP